MAEKNKSTRVTSPSVKNDRLFNERELLRQVAEGSEPAFTSLFHFYKDRIFSISLKLTKSSFLAEEVVQDVFLKIWLRREKLTDILDLERYIFVMARNIIFTSLKNTLLTQEFDESQLADLTVSYSHADSEILTREYEQVIQQAVERLSPQQKQIYLLSKEKELKRDEIAAIMELSSETVKTHLARAIRNVRAYSMSKLDVFITLLLAILVK